MRTTHALLVLAGLALPLGAGAQDPDLAALAKKAAVSGCDCALPARVELRAAGPAGLAALMSLYEESGRPAAMHEAIDAVARQRDAWASGLYWYTDLAEAERAARATGRPILSLRLLGNLDEELSCANSRFFRSVLYPNAEVARVLGSSYILHWQSERPAPRITVDFGDGRRMESTITGNSIHYLLDAEGQVVDALPGLEGPAAFLRWLADAGPVARDAANLSGAARAQLVSAYHRRKAQALDAALARDMSAAGVVLTASPAGTAPAAPDAWIAAPIALSKAVAETPMLRAVKSGGAPRDDDAASWEAIARLHASDAALDAASRAFIKGKRRCTDAELARTVAALETTLAEDGVRNEYLRHRRIHDWMAAGATDLEVLNRRVYAEIFLTPRSDPWLGLLPGDDYRALDGDGVNAERQNLAQKG
ncbi:MAG: hypothetical protein U0166_12185 [Acidobacteriota bacterium]